VWVNAVATEGMLGDLNPLGITKRWAKRGRDVYVGRRPERGGDVYVVSERVSTVKGSITTVLVQVPGEVEVEVEVRCSPSPRAS